jgi:integrase
VSEVTGLRWRDVNLAAGTLTVAKSKTDTGVRVVDLDPGLIDELKSHKAGSKFAGSDDYVFPGRGGKRRDRNAVRRRLLYPAIQRANAMLADRGLPTIPDGVTFHSLRRTYASLAAEAGVDPAWTARQIGHTDPGSRSPFIRTPRIAARILPSASAPSSEWAVLPIRTDRRRRGDDRPTLRKPHPKG